MKGEVDKFISCSCSLEVLRVNYMIEDDNGDPGWFEISILNSITNKPTLWQRVRMIWQILRTGTPYTDAICLEPEGVKKLKIITEEYLEQVYNSEKTSIISCRSCTQEFGTMQEAIEHECHEKNFVIEVR